jgi:peptide/nickel transport system substrate-binding protein
MRQPVITPIRQCGGEGRCNLTVTALCACGLPFSSATSSSNAERAKMAAIVQDDLKQLGMHVEIVPVEFRSYLDRVFRTEDSDACIMGLASFGADPNSDINMGLSSGGSHVWNLGEAKPATPWEAEIDRLMELQLGSRDFHGRKHFHDQVQGILSADQRVIFLAGPGILAGAKDTIGNFRPAILEPYVLWNVEQVYIRSTTAGGTQ